MHTNNFGGIPVNGRFITVLSIAVLLTPAYAFEVNKCVDADGRVTYTPEKCPPGSKGTKLNVEYGEPDNRTPQCSGGIRGSDDYDITTDDYKDNEELSTANIAYMHGDVMEAERQLIKYLQGKARFRRHENLQSYAAQALVEILCEQRRLEEARSISQRYGVPLFLKNVNERCNKNRECKRGLMCTNNRCIPKPEREYTRKAGEPCKKHDDCELGGLMCIDGVCKTPW